MDEKPIDSIEELVKILPSCNAKDFVDLASRLNIPKEAFEPYATWSKEKYTRNCIDRGEGYELLLLCWEEGLETPIHCHGGEECWVLMVEGTIKETRVKEQNESLIVENKETLEEGGISYMNDSMGFHSLQNLKQGRSMSLHLYMNPIDQCRVYDEDKEDFVVKDLQYDTYKGEPVTEKAASLESELK